MKRLLVIMTLMSLSLVACNRSERGGDDAVGTDTQMEQEGINRSDLDSDMGSGAGDVEGEAGAFGSGVGEEESLEPEMQEDPSDLGSGSSEIEESDEVRYEDDATLGN